MVASAKGRAVSQPPKYGLPTVLKNNTRSANIAADWFGVIGYRMKDWLAAANDLAAPQRGGGTGPAQLHFNTTTNANETLLAYVRSAALGYSATFFQRRIRWNVSLNVRNVFNDDQLIAQSGLSTAGVPVVFQYPEPRVFLLTKSFDC